MRANRTFGFRRRANGPSSDRSYVAAYEDVTRALADLHAIEQLHTAKVSKRYVDAATDEIADELREAVKS